MQWLIFATLKLVEVALVVFVPWGLGLFVNEFFPGAEWTKYPYIDGAICLVGAAAATACSAVVVEFVCRIVVPKNIEWSKKLHDKLKQRRSL
jgi:Na+-driven multidrug efflux pump